MGFVRVILLNQPLDRQACIDHHGPVHAHASVSASLTSRASRIKSAEFPGRDLPSRWLRPLSTPDQWQLGSTHPTFPISDCGCPKNPPSFTTVMVGASTNAFNYPIGLTKPSLGAVN